MLCIDAIRLILQEPTILSVSFGFVFKINPVLLYKAIRANKYVLGIYSMLSLLQPSSEVLPLL
jgi:hypothetical protein